MEKKIGKGKVFFLSFLLFVKRKKHGDKIILLNIFFSNFPCGYFKGLKDKSVLKGKCCFLVKVFTFSKWKKKLTNLFYGLKKRFFFPFKEKNLFSLCFFFFFGKPILV